MTKWALGLCGLVLWSAPAFAQFGPTSLRILGGGSITSDTTAPVCTITTPATNPFDAGTTTPQTVAGSCTDAVGVISVACVNTFTNVTVAATGTPGTTFNYSCSNVMANGSNTMQVRGLDAATNTGLANTVITYADPTSDCNHCIQPSTSFRSTDTGSSGAGWTGTTTGANFSTKQTNVVGSASSPADSTVVPPVSYNTPDEVSSTYNNPSGLGGLGLGHYVANTNTGNDVQNGSGARFTHAAVGEVWFQMCVKFPSPWAWVVGNGNSNASADPFNLKMVYNNSTSRTLTYGGSGMQFTVLSTTYTSGARMGETNIKWSTSFSDNDWHRVEVHLKTDTNGANGVVQVWQDNVLGLDVSTANYNMGTFEAWVVPSNMRYINNATNPRTIWFDDVLISVTQRINMDIC